MATRMPNPSVVPIVDRGGRLTSEWVRWLQGLTGDVVDAGTPAPPAPEPPAPVPAPDPGPVTADQISQLGVDIEGLQQAPDTDTTAWLAADLASGAALKGSALVGFLQSGTGAVARTVQSKLREVASAADYAGFDATGATDSSAAVAAGIAALPIQGGTLLIPGTPKFNIVITQPGIHLVGQGNAGGAQGAFPAAASQWQPWNTALPIVQIGNDTSWCAGCSVSHVTLNGMTTGVGGILFGAGAYSCRAEDITYIGFTTYRVKCQGGATYASSLNRIINSDMPDLTAGIGLDIAMASGASYTRAIYTEGLHISLGGTGIGIRSDGTAFFVSDTYIDCPTGATCIQLLKSGATSPVCYANGLDLACTGTGVALEATHSASLAMSDYMRGTCYTTGLLKNNAAATLAMYGDTTMYSRSYLMTAPMVHGSLRFPEINIAGFAADTSANIVGSSSTGVRRLTYTAERHVIMATGAGGGVTIGSDGVNKVLFTTNSFRPVTDNAYGCGDFNLRWAYLHAGYVNHSTAAPTAAAGTVTIGGITSTTIGAAGAAAALPAAPLGYIGINVGGVAAKIPYYSS